MAVTFEIPDHYYLEFTSNVELELQRMGPKLLPYVDTAAYSGEKAQIVQKYGETEMQELTTRYGDTEWAELSRTQRWIHPRFWGLHLPVDKKDQLQTMHEMTSPLVRAAAVAAGRKIDELILDSAFGTAYAGVQGTDSITWGNDVYGNALDMTVEHNQVETGSAATSNLTIGKLRLGLEKLVDNEVDVEREMPTFVGTVSQKHALLRTTEVTSSDYNTVKALVNGEVNTFMGIRFVWLSKNVVNLTADPYRRSLLFTPGALQWATWEGMETKISERADKNHTTQVSLYLNGNATRVDEKRIVEIDCNEAA
jgi:capsid protein